MTTGFKPGPVCLFAGSVCAGVLAVMMTAGVAHARSGEAVPSVRDDIRVRVAGRILPSCAIEQSVKSVEFDLMDETNGGTRATSVDLPFTIDCNASFLVRLRSTNGALRFEGGRARDSAFRTSVDYRASLNLPDGVDARRTSCGSQAMTGQATCDQLIKAEDGIQGLASITLAVESNGQPLLRGLYTDTLTLTVRPRLGGDDHQ